MQTPPHTWGNRVISSDHLDLWVLAQRFQLWLSTQHHIQYLQQSLDKEGKFIFGFAPLPPCHSYVLQALEQQVGLSLLSLMLLIRISGPIKGQIVDTGQSPASLPLSCTRRGMGFSASLSHHQWVIPPHCHLLKTKALGGDYTKHWAKLCPCQNLLYRFRFCKAKLNSKHVWKISHGLLSDLTALVTSALWVHGRVFPSFSTERKKEIECMKFLLNYFSKIFLKRQRHCLKKKERKKKEKCTL